MELALAACVSQHQGSCGYMQIVWSEQIYIKL